MPPSGVRPTRHREEAAAALVPFLMGGLLFIAAFAVVVQWGFEQGATRGPGPAGLVAADAESVANALVGSAGQGWYAAPGCLGDRPDAARFQPDAVRRIGLLREPCSGSPGFHDLSYEKLNNLGSARLARDPTNGKLDYEEARDSLDLAPSDFHVRTWPLVPDAQEVLRTGQRDVFQRAAYIGDYHSLTSWTYRIQRACGVTDGLTAVTLWIDLTNNGTTLAPFEVAFSIPLADRTVTVLKHTAPLVPGATVRTSLTVPKTLGWTWGAANVVTVAVADDDRSLGTCAIAMGGVSMTSLTTNRFNVVTADALSFSLSAGTSPVKVRYASYDGRGNSLAVSGRLDLVNALGLTVASDASLHARGWEELSATSLGAYTVRLSSALGVLQNDDVANVLAGEPLTFRPLGGLETVSPAPSTRAEATYLASLLAAFQPKVFDPRFATSAIPYAAGGDVFPDFKDVLNRDLPAFLIDGRGTPSANDDVGTTATYNLLVIGSNVDHHAMTSESAKQSIRDWVLAGGYLIVMGSAQQSVEWLQPLFGVSLVSASQAPTRADDDHPVLRAPNPLDHATFQNRGTAWQFSAGAAVSFAHVVVAGGADVLGVSMPGAYGEGRVLLTSWRPYDLQGNGATGDCDPATLAASCPALGLLQNMFTLGYRDLYLDYGPAIPDDRDVGVARRTVTVWHPDLQAQIELAMLVFVF